MNETLKSICALLRSEETELQRAAAIVFARIHPRDPDLVKALGETLLKSSDPDVAGALLQALRAIPHENAIQYLLGSLANDLVPRKGVLEAIANIGPKAVGILRKLLPKGTPSVRLAVAKVLPRIRTANAYAFLADLFHEKDPEVVRVAVHSLREEIGNFNKKQRIDLVRRLKASLGEKRLQGNSTALSAVLISLGIVAEKRSKKFLLPYVDAKQDSTIRRHALMSLACLEYSGEGHGDAIRAMMSILEENDLALVRLAVEVLERIRPRRSDAENLTRLLASPHSIVQAYAIHALGRLDTVAYAQVILSFLGHQDHNLREAARAALSLMSTAPKVIIQKLDSAASPEEAEDLVQILGGHRAHIPPIVAREMARRLFGFLERGDTRAQYYRDALLAVSPETLTRAVLARANLARRRRDFSNERNCLKLLVHTPAMTAALRFRLAVAKLKSSRKDPDPLLRQGDYCLALIAELLREGGKDFIRAFLAESILDPDDYFYVGYHFCERLNEERRFGSDVLRHVARKWRHRACARAACDKLREEGH
ncbi:MAG: HEAT repeat domain-containing protein [Planctomycetota bacterium]